MNAKCKKFLTMLLLVCVSIGAAGCSAYSNQRYYERAQLMMGSGEYAEAAELFHQLGEYEDSAEYALYAAALDALQNSKIDLARANLLEIAPFKSADRYLRYLDALDAENEGELDSALDIYVSLGSFEDCAERAQTLEAAIPEQAIRQGRQLMSQGDYEGARDLFRSARKSNSTRSARGDYEGARDLFLSLNGYGQSRALSDACTAAIARKAYLAAEDLLGAGDYLGAMNAFAAMGDTLDAAHRAEECRLLLLKQAEEAFQAVTLETADALDEQLESLSADAAFAEIRQALAEKFGVNLSLLRAARSEHPYVLLGTYPMGESGAESDVLWQVLRVDGNQLVLLCCSVIDASSVATTSDLPMADTPDAAEISLPSAADLATLTDLTCAATPYAAAQGASAVYWLRDTLESGIHPVISETGALTLPADTEVPGIRPLALLDLTAYVFTAGDGTEENPYR